MVWSRIRFVVCAFMVLGTVGCGAGITAETTPSTPPRISMKVGLHVTPAAREFVATLYANTLYSMDFDTGAYLRTAAERRFHDTFDRVVFLYEFPPHPGEIKDIDRIIVLDKPALTVKDVTAFDYTYKATAEFPVRVYDQDARLLSQTSQTATIEMMLGSLAPTENISLWMDGMRRLVDNGVVAILNEYAATSPALAVSPARTQPIRIVDVGTGVPATTVAGGIFTLEDKIAFNTLGQVAFDAASGTVTLIGHYDARVAGPRIPYFQHLAELLDHPEPEFSLDWTPESERAVDAFLRRMDGPTQMAALPSEMGDWFDPFGFLNEEGQRKLRTFGVQPVKDGRRPGFLGVKLGERYEDRNGLEIQEVTPGSPAARAGITTRDALDIVDGHQLWHPMEAFRVIGRAGAGTTVEVMIHRPDGMIDVMHITLDEGTDAWGWMTRPDAVALLLETAGNRTAANVVEAIQRMHRLAHGPHSYDALSMLYLTANGEAMGFQTAINRFEGYIEDYRQGVRSSDDTMRIILREVFDGIQQGLDTPYGALTSAFDSSIRRGMDNDTAYNDAIAEFNQQIEPIVDRAMRTLMQRREEVVLTVSEVEENLGTRPVVVPDFIGVDPRSQLARAMFEADYLGKSLFFQPDLAARIPGYQTEYGFYADRPAIASAADERMWISIDSLDLARSPDGTALAFNDVKMRFNIRDVRSGRVAEPGSDDYPALLTSLYDDLAGEFPVLHELEEIAKLAAAARWIKGVDPGFALPQSGRVGWQPPSQVSGMVHMI